jgi:hypothetical protein
MYGVAASAGVAIIDPSISVASKVLDDPSITGSPFAVVISYVAVSVQVLPYRSPHR